MQTTRGFLAILCAGAALLGCGNDDNGGPRQPYRSGVTPPSGTTTIASLDDDAKRRLCTSLDAHVTANVSFDAIAYAVCLPGAIVAGGDQKGCETRLAQCMDAFPEPVAITAHLQDESICFRDLGQCQASVAALETCVNVNLDAVFDIFDNWSCAGVDDENERKAAADAMDTASVCADLDAACNNFADVTGPD